MWHRRRGRRSYRLEAERYLPGGSSRGTAYFGPYPFFVDRTEGHHVVDVDGNRYLDFMLNATTYVLGHSNDRVVEAVREQATDGLSYSTPHESQVRLAQVLCERVPSVEKVRFTNSGTEGTLNAIRAARAYHGQAQDRQDRGRVPREPRVRVGERLQSVWTRWTRWSQRALPSGRVSRRAWSRT